MNVKSAKDFDDILIIPKASSINSRDDVDLHSDFYGLYPIFSSPMAGISGVKLVKEMSRLNCLGILHRFAPIEQRYEWLDELKETNFGVSIGIRDIAQEIKFADAAVLKGAKLICVDVANGYTDKLKDFVENISFTVLNIMAGCVVTYEGALSLKYKGANFIRVGIGSGGLCSTRNVTGIGVPQLTAIEDCAQLDNVYIVADGGIKNSGNAVKAFAVGADFVILGSLLAYAEESEATQESKNFISGMASKTIQELYYGKVKSVEGLTQFIDPTKVRPLEEIITEFLYGIKSGCTYLNCSSYKQIKDNAKFVEAGRNSIKNL